MSDCRPDRPSSGPRAGHGTIPTPVAVLGDIAYAPTTVRASLAALVAFLVALLCASPDGAAYLCAMAEQESDCCCCHEDSATHEGPEAKRATCCESAPASVAPTVATAPEPNWPSQFLALAAVDSVADPRPAAALRWSRPLARGPPPTGPPSYILYCSYLI